MNFTDWYGNYYDYIHPMANGHATIADMVVWMTQQAAMQLVMDPWSSWDQEELAAAVPRPMYPGM